MFAMGCHHVKTRFYRVHFIGSSLGKYEYPANKEATLYPVDGNGKEGESIQFPVPIVKYEYKAPVNNKKIEVTHHIKKIVNTGDTENLVLLFSILTIALATTRILSNKKNIK